MSEKYRIEFSDPAKKSFDAIMSRDTRLGAQIGRAIDRLIVTPNLGGALHGEWKGYFKYRTGNFRIIYRVKHHRLLIYIIRIGNRRDVYG